MSYLDIALRSKEEEGIEKNPHTLIDQTIREINKAWESGALEWMKANRPDDWKKMVVLEQKINQVALKVDMKGLKEVLGKYKELILNMLGIFKTPKGKTGDLFNSKMKEINCHGEPNHCNL